MPSLDESLAKAVELGGTVIHDPIETPWGRWAIFTDATGADVAIIEHHLPTQAVRSLEASRLTEQHPGVSPGAVVLAGV